MNTAQVMMMLTSMASQLSGLAQIAQSARTQNRDLTDAEVDALVGADTAAKLRLQAAIAAVTVKV